MSAFAKSNTGSTYSPNASFAPARALSRGVGSHCTHLASGCCVSTCWICAASVGEFTVSVTMRSPAPFVGICAESTPFTAATKLLQGRTSPSCVIVFERSGS